MIKAVMIFFLGSLISEAGMHFESKLLELSCGAEENAVEGEFLFEIKEEDLEIEKFDAPCTCLTAKVEPTLDDDKPKLHWKKGEKGKVSFRFNVGNLRGTIDKEIKLQIKGEKQPVKLTVRLKIATLLEIQPSTHLWKVGEAATPKVFKLKVHHSDPIKISELSGQKENFPYEVKTIKEGWEYEITVTPRTTKTPLMGRIAIFTDCKIRRYRRHQIYTLVKAEEKE